MWPIEAEKAQEYLGSLDVCPFLAMSELELARTRKRKGGGLLVVYGTVSTMAIVSRYPSALLS